MTGTAAGMSTSTMLHVLTLALTLTPVTAQLANTFKYVGLSGVSAQQLFLGTKNKVYIIDKTGMLLVFLILGHIHHDCTSLDRGELDQGLTMQNATMLRLTAILHGRQSTTSLPTLSDPWMYYPTLFVQEGQCWETVHG